jgi:ion channel-forming bestrophin family protein
MIVRGSPTFRDVFFAVRGSILRKILGPLLLMIAVSVAAVMIVGAQPAAFSHLAAIPFTLIGLSLSIFMSFRNTTCYERWWEGRKLWGQLIISTRCFARQVATLEPEVRDSLLRGLCAFAAGLAAKLRGRDEQAAIAAHVTKFGGLTAPNPTDAVLAAVGRQCRVLIASGALDSVLYGLMEHHLAELSLVQGGCERIRYTPLPFSYSLLLHRTAYAFCLLLPFALAPSLGWWSMVPTFLLSYAFFGLDALGDELSDPFGTEPNDLPLDAMVRLVEREMLHAMGRNDLPPPLAAENYVLL